MELFFDLDLFESLIEKAEQRNILSAEHAYLQKLIAAQLLLKNLNYSIKTVSSKKEDSFFLLVKKYRSAVLLNWQNLPVGKLEKTDLFLLKTMVDWSETTSLPFAFEHLQIIANIWGAPLQKNSASLRNFLSFYLNQLLLIQEHLLPIFWSYFDSSVKLSKPFLLDLNDPLFSYSYVYKTFLSQVESLGSSVCFVPGLTRYFSIVGRGHPGHLFMEKKDEYSIVEISAIVHETRHFIDIYEEYETSLFFLERNALKYERKFLVEAVGVKKAMYYWFHTNFIQPMLLLESEFEYLVNGKRLNAHDQALIGLESLTAAPFEKSLYCAAVLDLNEDQNSLCF